MSQPLDECKARLASIQSYRRQFVMVTRATVTSSKTVDFSFRGPLGFEARIAFVLQQFYALCLYCLAQIAIERSQWELPAVCVLQIRRVVHCEAMLFA